MAKIKDRVLIVDDFALVRGSLKKAVFDAGVKDVIEAEDGELAFNALVKAHTEGQPITLIFTDWNMPNVDGFEFLLNCKKDPRFENTPIIFVTAETEKDQILKALRAGATDYLMKPFTNVAVTSILNDYFPDRKKLAI